MEGITIKMHQNKSFLEDYKCKLFETKDPVYKNNCIILFFSENTPTSEKC